MTQPPQHPSGFQPSPAPPPQNGPYGQQNFYGAAQPPQPPQPQSNVVGIIAFIAALFGFVLACLPFMLPIDTVVLGVSAILGFAGLLMKDQKNLWPIVALCTVLVGGVLGFIIELALTIGLFVVM